MTDDDFETYLVSYAREQQSKKFGAYDPCAKCGHEWHGLPCSKGVTAPGGSAPCMCLGGQQ